MAILVTIKGSNFVYFQIFSKISGLLTMNLSSRFSNPNWWLSSTFTEKVLKKADGRALFVEKAYTLSSISEKDYGNKSIEAVVAKMNANIDAI